MDTLLEGQGNAGYHARWVLAIVRSEVTPEASLYNKSLKRLCLQTGLPVRDVQRVLGMLMADELIEPAGSSGWKVVFEGTAQGEKDGFLA